jgi:hypothetical protein
MLQDGGEALVFLAIEFRILEERNVSGAADFPYFSNHERSFAL